MMGVSGYIINIKSKINEGGIILKKSLCLSIVLVCSLLVFNLVVLAEEINFLSEINSMKLKSINIKSINNIDKKNLEDIAQRIINYTASDIYPDKEFNQNSGNIKRYESISNEYSYLEIYNDINTISFNKGYDYTKKESTFALPTEKTAAAMAEKHLKKLDLLADESELVLLHVGGVNMDVYNPETGEKASYEKLRTVRYGRKISGLSVVGPGSRIIVKLGTNGQLNGLVYNWADYSAEDISSEIAIRSIDSLDQEINSKVKSAAKEGTSGSINKELLMYDDGKGHIEPAIYVKTDIEFASGNEVLKSQYDFYVPLLKSPKAEYPNVSSTLISPMKDSLN